ncbi:MAG: PASTA domain-containing protein [Chloroflexota bacterium]
MPGIFISYRREDTAGHAGRIFDRLREKFGQDRVFMDVSAIEPGVDFVEAIDRAVGSCDVLLVIIGKKWLSCSDASGRRRLDDPKDFIRLETATALRRDVRVIPVLVQDAAMPGEGDLPDDLKKLARRQATEIGDTHWDSDLAQLFETLERVLASGAGPTPAMKGMAEKRFATPVQKSRLIWLIGSITAVVIALTGLITGIQSFRDAFVQLFRGSPPVTTTGGPQSPGTVSPPSTHQPMAPAAVTVPKVVGMPEQEAVDTLRNAGFSAEVEQRISPDDRPGTVFHQEPPAEASLQAGGVVILRVARTPTPQPQQPSSPSVVPVVVPNVVGQTSDRALSILREKGFSAEVVGEDESTDVPAGTVLRSFPKAGDKLESGGKVGLVLATKPAKPELVTVPNVVRQPLERAVQMLTEAGLQPGTQTKREVDAEKARPGTVLNQKMKGGSRVKRGTAVDLLVAIQPTKKPAEEMRDGTQPRKVLAKGRLDIHQTYLFDLDTGKVREEDADFWFEAVTETERYLTPRNGATIGFIRERGNYESCSRAKMAGRRIPIEKLPTNGYACVRTSRGNLGSFRLTEPVGPSPGVLKIGYIIWE